MSSQSRGSALHYIECATCSKYSKFYCNTCHQRMCEQCRDIHLREKENRKHDVVLYQNRIQELPEEKCQIHPKKVFELYCIDCPAPVCSKCFASDHNGHQVLDLETVYNESLQQYQKELIRIQDTILPQSVEKLMLHRQRVGDVKKDIEKLRISMKKSADEIKAVVDVILAENNAKLDTFEKSILDEMDEQEKKAEEYISYLEKLKKDYENGMPSRKPTEVITVSKEISTNSLLKSPAASEHVLPEFKKGAVIKEEIERQFGEISQRTERDLNTIQSSMQDASSVVEVKKIDLSSICTIYHLSFIKSGIFWASDDNGNLIQLNKKGKPLSGFSGVPNVMGYHTVTQKGELIFTNKEYSSVCKFNKDMTVSYIINTGDWEPTAICFSHINRDILLGLVKGTEEKIASYRKNTQRNSPYLKLDCYVYNLCGNITYITENINCDICISDCDANQVMVVTKSGEYRFSYSGHISQSGFLPYGICTDFLGHILVCNDHPDALNDNSSIHILDQHGKFVYLLPAPDQCPLYPGALVLMMITISWSGAIRGLQSLYSSTSISLPRTNEHVTDTIKSRCIFQTRKSSK